MFELKIVMVLLWLLIDFVLLCVSFDMLNEKSTIMVAFGVVSLCIIFLINSAIIRRAIQLQKESKNRCE